MKQIASLPFWTPFDPKGLKLNLRRKGFSNILIAPLVVLVFMIMTFTLFRIQIAFFYQMQNEEILAAVMRWSTLKLHAANSCYEAEEALKRIAPTYVQKLYQRGARIQISQELSNRFKTITVSADYEWPINIGLSMRFRRKYVFYTDFFQSRDHRNQSASLLNCFIEPTRP